MTPKRRKMISKSLLDLFSLREQEYEALVNERAECFSEYDTGDDATQRELHKEISETINLAMNEIEKLGNYQIIRDGYTYKLLTFETVDLATKVWTITPSDTLGIKYDCKYLWQLLPNYSFIWKGNLVNRPADLLNYDNIGLYYNFLFNTTESGEGVNDPNINGVTVPGNRDILETRNLPYVPGSILPGISMATIYGVDSAGVYGDINSRRVFDAFTDLRTAFINAGSFRASGINFNSDSWPPHDVYGDDGYVPIVKIGNYNVGTTSKSATTDFGYPNNAWINGLIPENKWVVCTDASKAIIKIVKILTVTENETSSGNEGGSYYTYNFTASYKPLSIHTNSTTDFYIHNYLAGTSAYLVFENIRSTYISNMNALLSVIKKDDENYNSANSLYTAINDFLTYLNSGVDLNVVANVEDFYTRASAFNTLVLSRISTLNTSITNTDNIDDLKELITLRISKADGTVFNLFRKMEGMDSQYRKYKRGSRRIDFLKKKMIVAKVVEQPNNQYQITIDKKLNENYANTMRFSIGDTITIVDETHPELTTKIVDIKEGTIDDVDSSKISGDDVSSATKKKDVKFITTDRIISSDFDKDDVLRIIKEL